MKKNLIALVVVVLLFGALGVAMLGAKQNDDSASASGAASTASSDATVKICPHSGLPCDGDDDCESGCESGCEE